jgi:hypothetical protein
MEKRNFMVEADANELTELECLDIVEFIPRQMFDQVIAHWVSRLAHKGRITLSFVDLYTVSRLFFLQKLSLAEMNFLLHGDQQPKVVNLTLPEASKILEKLGLKIIRKDLDGVKGTIIGERP